MSVAPERDLPARSNTPRTTSLDVHIQSDAFWQNPVGPSSYVLMREHAEKLERQLAIALENNAAPQDTAVHCAEEVAAGDARSETPAGAAPAPAWLTTPQYYSYAPRDHVGQKQALEHAIGAFNAEPDELVELLDALLGKFCRTHERDPRIADVEHCAGKLRFFLVRMT